MSLHEHIDYRLKSLMALATNTSSSLQTLAEKYIKAGLITHLIKARFIGPVYSIRLGNFRGGIANHLQAEGGKESRELYGYIRSMPAEAFQLLVEKVIKALDDEGLSDNFTLRRHSTINRMVIYFGTTPD
jgi:hypothetical protein